MTRKITRWLATTTTLIVAFSLAACGSVGSSASPDATSGSTPGASATPGEPIRIGLNIPMSGAVSYLGEDFIQGVTLAVEEINDAGGVLGRPLEVVTADGECAPQPAVTAARHLADVEEVDVMMGQVCSSAGLAVMEILPELQIPNLTVVMTNPAITGEPSPGGGWMFRLNVNDGIMADTFASVIAEQADSVAIFGANDDFGRGVSEAYASRFEPLNVTVTSTEYFEHGEPDYRAVLSRVKEDDPDALLLAMEYGDADIFMRQFHELDMTQLVFARGSVVVGEFLELIADDCSVGEGIKEAGMWNSSIDTPQNQALNEAYRERWDRESTLVGAMSYYGVHTIAEAIRTSGQADPEGIRDGLAAVGFESGIGQVDFDDHNQAHPLMAISTITDCEIVLDSTVETAP